MPEKVRKIERIFNEIDNKTALLQKDTQIFCPQYCILCCLKPGFEVNVLECLPLAWHIVSDGQHEKVLEQIESSQEVCICLNREINEDTHPGCKYYTYRPAICRLFGSSAVSDRKSGSHSLYTCKTLKENYAEEWESISKKIKLAKSKPVVADYYLQLQAIDPYLAADYNPINQSILKAIGAVSLNNGFNADSSVASLLQNDNQCPSKTLKGSNFNNPRHRRG